MKRNTLIIVGGVLASVILCAVISWGVSGGNQAWGIKDKNGGLSVTVEDRKNSYIGMRVQGDPGTNSMLVMEKYATGTSNWPIYGTGLLNGTAQFIYGACITSLGAAASTLVLSDQITASSGGSERIIISAPATASTTQCIALPAPAYFTNGVFATVTAGVGTYEARAASW